MNSWIDKKIDEQELGSLTSELVKIPTINPPDNTEKIIKFIGTWFKQKGFDYEIYEFETGHFNIVSSYHNSGPTILLNGHVDVVPPGDLSKWNFDPFSGEIKGGKVLGRGTTDMKGGVAVVMVIYSILRKYISNNIQISIVAGEESGGLHGTKLLVEKGIVKGDAAIVPEPTGLNNIVIGEKGLAQMKITTYGTSAHGSLPTFGDNAIVSSIKAAKIIEKLVSKKIRVKRSYMKLVEDSKSFFESIAKNRGITDPEKLKKTRDLIDHTSYSLNVINGGVKDNVVPDLCTMEIDMRMPHGMTYSILKQQISAALNKEHINFKLEPINESNPSFTDPDATLVQMFKDTIKKNLNSEPRLLMFLGASDGRYFRYKNIPTVIYGPGNLENAHVVDECVNISDLKITAQIIADSILGYFQSKNKQKH